MNLKTSNDMKTMKNIALLLTIVLTLVQGFASYAWGGTVASGTYELVTSTSGLVAGKKYIIAGNASGTLSAAKCFASSSATNLKGYALTTSFDTADPETSFTLDGSEGVAEITLGGTSGNWTLNEGSYYLCSAGEATSSQNYCKPSSTIGGLGAESATRGYHWAITAGKNTGQWSCNSTTNTYVPNLKNNSGTISCYKSGSAGYVYFYKKVETVTLHYGERGNRTYELGVGLALPNVNTLSSYAVPGWTETTKWATATNKNYTVTTGVDPTPTAAVGATPSETEYWAVYHGDGSACPSTDWVSTKPVPEYTITLSPSSGTNHINYREAGGTGNCCNPGATNQHIEAVFGTAGTQVTMWTATWDNNGTPTTLSFTPSGDNSYITFTMPNGNVTITANFECPNLASQPAPTVNHTTPVYNDATGKWSSTISWSSVTGANKYLLTIRDVDGSSVVLDAHDCGNTKSYTYETFNSNVHYTATVRAKNTCGATYKDSEAHAILCECADISGSTPTITAPSITTTGGKINWSMDGAAKYTVEIKGPSPSSTVVWSQTKGTATNYTLSVATSDAAARTYTVEVTAYNFCDNASTKATQEVVVPKTASWYDYKAWCPEPTVRVQNTTSNVGNKNVYVTNSYDSDQKKSIRAVNTLTVTAENLAIGSHVTLTTPSGSGVYFSTTLDLMNFTRANKPEASLKIYEDGAGNIDQEVYVHYMPAAAGTNGLPQTVTVTATYSVDGSITNTQDIYVRNLPEKFAIAIKVGDNWYALPAAMGSTGDVFEGIMIEVDEVNKKAYASSDEVGYKLWSVKTNNTGAPTSSRYETKGDYVRFAGYGDHGLWANNASTGSDVNNIKNDATIAAIGANVTDNYEWKISTNDLDAYTIQSDQTNNTKNLGVYRPTSGNHKGQLVWATNESPLSSEIHLFPIEERAKINIIPREWKQTGLVFSIDADNNISLTSGDTKYGINASATTNATIQRHSTGGYGLYEVTLPSLLSEYGKWLTLKMSIGGVATYAYTRIPIIVHEDKNTSSSEPFATLGTESKSYDVVVLGGATLSTNASNTGAYRFSSMYIYPGATLVNNTNTNLALSYLELRSGITGIDAKSTNATDVPHVLWTKAITSCDSVFLDVTVNTAHGYALSVPFDVTLSTVNYANSLKPGTGAKVNGTLASQFFIREYDGSQRATGATGWKDITSTSRVLHAGEGYTVQAKRPKGQPFAVIRFPLTKTGVAGWTDSDGEVAKSAITVTPYGGTEGTPDNDKGWNLIANPYMANVSYKDEDESSFVASFIVGKLVKSPNEANWDGTYKWIEKTNDYVTIPNESYTEFPQDRAKNVVFEPFKNFFIQASGEGPGTVTFSRTARKVSMPRHLMAMKTTEEPLDIDIDVVHGATKATAGITVDADATPGYKYGEDTPIMEGDPNLLTYLKAYTVVGDKYLVGNVITKEEANELIPLEFYAAEGGEYTIRLSSSTEQEKLEYIILYDKEEGTTNLLMADHNFTLSGAGLIQERFSIGLKVKEENTATDIEAVVAGQEDFNKPLKFLYRGQIYILNNGVIYDATGKRVQEINK